MIDLNKVSNIFLYTNKTDMRMGMNKIEILLSLIFAPIDILHSVFIFVSKNRKQARIYYENEFGKWLLINKLSYSLFHAPNSSEKLNISKEDLSLLLKGVAMLEERKKQVAI